MQANFDATQISRWKSYRPQNRIRFVTATSLFDGHDASINIFRRLLQARGAEVIHLGHNRSAHEVVSAAIQEDVQGIALSSYQGGHIEYFKYIRQLLNSQGGEKIKIFGGGGGVITPEEIEDLHRSGIQRIYSPEDGQILGLDGIIGHMLCETDFTYLDTHGVSHHEVAKCSRLLTLAEQNLEVFSHLDVSLGKPKKNIPVLGITGTGGAGKSSLTDELLLRFVYDFSSIKIALICIDPTKKKTGGALLGDRIRINSASMPQMYLRSFASRESGEEIAEVTSKAIEILKHFAFDLIIVETSGIGQGNTSILKVSDLSLYVMTPEYGASTQLEKIDMLDYADLIAINKCERLYGLDAVRDVRNVLRRSRFQSKAQPDENYPVYGTIASRFNDDGVNGLYLGLLKKIKEKFPEFKFFETKPRSHSLISTARESLIPSSRSHYLSHICEAVKSYHRQTAKIVDQVHKAESLAISSQVLQKNNHASEAEYCKKLSDNLWSSLPPELTEQLNTWPTKYQKYFQDDFSYLVRGKEVKVSAHYQSLAKKKYPKIVLPNFASSTELAKYLRKEGAPGEFPFTAGIFPFRRQGEEPKRQFAGEGGPGRTNARFHYLSANDPAKRLSTAFDSITLYGSDPEERPDIYGKIGESGVSICTIDDLKLLYSGFDLCGPSTSVSMTINGPAPIILAMFLNTAIDQQIENFVKKHSRAPSPSEHQEIYDCTLQTVRGTVQADILKEDQAQNTCIFSTEFALKLMADVQEYFIEKNIRNYYSVSISGYHIAEAGANPITQLAFTLANGFTYVEYYLAKGLKIDDFAPNLSFFFSNGLDPEYTVIGRVARRIWAIAMRDYYHANERCQKLKYHIQTSGRSLHAQEMDFNDIRTTLQALIALMDNCNSLHTNAYDEALTTPTEESVRRAMAIQLIINQEFGLNKCENAAQGSFNLELFTDLVEEAVLSEFENLSKRGGVLGAMETQYQRSKIQEESLYYEELKHHGEYPIIGVNTYIKPQTDTQSPRQATALIRASYEEKNDQLKRLQDFKNTHSHAREQALENLKQAVLSQKNIFSELMHTVRFASLGEITSVLYQVGGQYRRSM